MASWLPKPRSTSTSMSSRLRISFARSSSTFSGSPFTRSGRRAVPSEGMKVTLTLVVSMAAPFESGTEPVAARTRPQLQS